MENRKYHVNKILSYIREKDRFLKRLPKGWGYDPHNHFVYSMTGRRYKMLVHIVPCDLTNTRGPHVHPLYSSEDTINEAILKCLRKLYYNENYNQEFFEKKTCQLYDEHTDDLYYVFIRIEEQ